MKSSSSKRRELLAGFVGAFQSDFLNKAIADGNLDRAVLFAREIVQHHDVTTSKEVTEYDTAMEFLEQFNRKEGFDEFMADESRNPERILLVDIDSTGWTDEAIMTACRA